MTEKAKIGKMGQAPAVLLFQTDATFCRGDGVYL